MDRSLNCANAMVFLWSAHRFVDGFRGKMPRMAVSRKRRYVQGPKTSFVVFLGVREVTFIDSEKLLERWGSSPFPLNLCKPHTAKRRGSRAEAPRDPLCDVPVVVNAQCTEPRDRPSVVCPLASI